MMLGREAFESRMNRMKSKLVISYGWKLAVQRIEDEVHRNKGWAGRQASLRGRGYSEHKSPCSEARL